MNLKNILDIFDATTIKGLLGAVITGSMSFALLDSAAIFIQIMASAGGIFLLILSIVHKKKQIKNETLIRKYYERKTNKPD